MIRFLLLICTMMILPAAETVSAPVIRFTELEWWGASGNGGSGWWSGLDRTQYPTRMGHIEEAPLTGRQEIVWENGNYLIEAVRRESDTVCTVTFSKGSLLLIHLGGRRWQVEFTPTGKKQPERIFRTDRPAPAGSTDTPDVVHPTR